MTQKEALADYAHRAWSGWIKYMFSKCQKSEYGSLIIPKRFADRWVRQAETDYVDLPENEKESDRHEAQKILDIIRETPHDLKSSE